MRRPTTCKHCGKKIIWAKTVNDRFVALDAEELGLPQHAHYVLDHRGNAHMIASGPYRVHAETCLVLPDALAARQGENPAGRTN